MRRSKAQWLRLPAHLAVLAPLALIVWDYTQHQLSANPIEDIEIRTGRATLLILVLSLSCTPINIISGMRWVLRLRRMLGLYAFGYACVHLLAFIGLDYGFNFGLIWQDSGEKRYILAGLAALLCLLPLAVTSTRNWRKRLGRGWERLHWLAYAAAVLGVTHLTWEVKLDYRLPVLYGAVVALLLIVRLPPVRKGIVRARSRVTGIAPS